MSTSTLPREGEVQTSGPKGWRFAEGQIVTGRAADDNLEVRESITGKLLRVGIFEGDLDDGTRYGKIEAEIETADGVISVAAPHINAANGKPTFSSCITFLEGLLDCEKDEIVKIAANKANKPNRFGTYSTYVNMWHVSQSPTGKWVANKTKAWPCIGEPPEWNQAYLDELMEALREHPAFGDRPQRTQEQDGSAPWDKFAQVLVNADWPPFQAAYLKLANKAAGKEFAKAEDVPESVWDGLAEQVNGGKVKMPAYIAELQTQEVPDPFGDD